MKFYLRALAIIAVLGLFNYAGEALLWYDTVPFYDVYMHLLGGIGIGLFAIALLNSWRPGYVTGRRGAAIVIAMVAAAGIVWEIYEAIAGTSGNPFGTKAYILDTTKDFINDLVGGTASVWIHKTLTNRTNKAAVDITSGATIKIR